MMMQILSICGVEHITHLQWTAVDTPTTNQNNTPSTGTPSCRRLFNKNTTTKITRTTPLRKVYHCVREFETTYMLLVSWPKRSRWWGWALRRWWEWKKLLIVPGLAPPVDNCWRPTIVGDKIIIANWRRLLASTDIILSKFILMEKYFCGKYEILSTSWQVGEYFLSGENGIQSQPLILDIKLSVAPKFIKRIAH